MTVLNPQEWVDRHDEDRVRRGRDSTTTAEFKVWIPRRTVPHPRSSRDFPEREDRAEVRFDDHAKIGRGGTGYVWIGHTMVHPKSFLEAVNEIAGLQADTSRRDEVGFEWSIKGGNQNTRDRFELKPGYDGEVALIRSGVYDDTIDEVYRIDDLIRAFGLLGLLEQEGPQVLAPLAIERPVEVFAMPSEPTTTTPVWTKKRETMFFWIAAVALLILLVLVNAGILP